MTLGRPVVTTPVGFAADLIDDGVTGWLVPVGDAAALAGALTAVLSDPEARGARWERRAPIGWRPCSTATASLDAGRRRLPPGPAAHVRRAVPMVLAALAVVLGLGGLRRVRCRRRRCRDAQPPVPNGSWWSPTRG